MSEKMQESTSIEERKPVVQLSDLTDTNAFYTTMQAKTNEEKMALAHSMMNPDNNLRDCINMTLNIKDVICEIVDVSREDGTSSEAPRIILIDTEGTSYVCVSTGIWNALKKIILIFGAPTWEEGLPLKVRQINKKDRAILTLDMV